MNTSKLITHAGLTINMADVKCIKLRNFSNIGKPNTMTVEFKTRFTYVQHPITGEFELRECHETTELEYPDYDTAKAYTLEWIEFWKEYLEEIYNDQFKLFVD